MDIAASNPAFNAVYSNGFDDELTTPVVVWKLNDDGTVIGMVAQSGYAYLMPATILRGFKRYEKEC